MRLSIFTLLFCSLCYNSFSQIVPKEDYITCKTVYGSTLNLSNNLASKLKDGAFLYYNDSCVLLHIDGLKNKTFFFKIYKKEWDKMQKFAIISCFDSTKNTRHPNLKELQDSTPDLVITIGYSGNPAIDSNLSNYTKPTYVSITCHFYSKGFDIDFGLLVKFIKKDIPMIRKKYARSIIG